MKCRPSSWTVSWFGFFVIAVTTRAYAADMFWANTAGGTFSFASNWTGGTIGNQPPPNSDDVAHFGQSTSTSTFTYTVSFSTSPTNQRLVVEDDRVTFDLNSHLYSTSQTLSSMTVGTVAGRSGRLTITDGTVAMPFQSDLDIATASGGSGILTVDAGGLVAGTMILNVGVSGDGVLRVNAGGDLIADETTLGSGAGSSGTASITGAGSSLLTAALGVGGAGTGSLTVASSGRVDSSSASISASTGTAAATVTNAGSQWRVTDKLKLFDGGNLNVFSGGLVTDKDAEVFGGVATVDGINSKWSHSGYLLVQSSLNITGGGLVENTNAVATSAVGGNSATVAIAGGNSRWILAGDLQVGTTESDNRITVTNGGLLESSSASLGIYGEILDDFGVPSTIIRGQGSAVVSGVNSRWQTTNELTVGSGGVGQLDVTDGGLMSSPGGFIGRFGRFNGSLGTVNVTGAGSQWQAGSGTIEVGGQGLSVPFGGVFAAEGRLNITSGGTVSSGAGLIGADFLGNGLATVSGAGSQWLASSEITVGDEGSGQMIISSGGVVTSNLGSIGKSAGGGGFVYVDGLGSVWHVTSVLNVGFAGFGFLEITNGGRIEAADVSVLEFGELSGDGLIVANVINGGGVTPGISFPTAAGMLQIDGTYSTQAAGTLNIKLGGTTRGAQYDALDVTLGATLAGTLNVSLFDGFTPVAGQSFDILDAASISGAFAVVNLPTLDAGLDWDASQLLTAGVLSVIATGIPGDFDFDGDVDGTDFLLWQRNPAVGNLADWRNNFGAPLVANSTAVPEPCSISIVFLTTCSTLAFGRYVARGCRG